jgi:hypothetical protein
MAIPQQSTTSATESTASVAGATSSQLIDLVQLFSSAVQAVVSRQVMVVGDPTNQNGYGAVSNTVPGGAEFAQIMRLSNGNPELQAIMQELRNIRAELQTLNYQMGTLPATPPVLSNIDLNQ